MEKHFVFPKLSLNSGSHVCRESALPLSKSPDLDEAFFESQKCVKTTLQIMLLFPLQL